MQTESGLPGPARRLCWSAAASMAVCCTNASARVSGGGPISPILSPPSSPLPRGVPVSVSLDAAIALGLRDNRAIRSAYLDRVVQKSGLFVTESRFLPRLDVAADISADRAGDLKGETSRVSSGVSWHVPTGANVNFSWDRRIALSSRSGFDSETVGVSVVQPLLRGAGPDVNMAPIRIARLQDQVNHLVLKASVSSAVTAIVFAYRELLQAQEQVRLTRLSLDRMQDLLTVNHTLIDAGRMAAADIVQTESSLANVQVGVLQAERQKTSAQLALLQLLAVDPHTNIVAGDQIAVEHVPIALEQAVARGLATRMDLLAQQLAVEQGRQDVLIAKNDELWDLSLAGGVSRRSDAAGAFGRETRTDRSIGLQLNFSIGDFAKRHRRLQARTDVRVAQIRYEDLSQSVESQIRDAVQTAEASWLQLDAARRAKILAQRALALQREKFSVGRASNFEVLSFQADLSAADNQELTAAITYLNALTILDQQVGSTLDTWKIALND